MTDGASIDTAILDRLRQWLSGTFESNSAPQARIEHEDAIFTHPNGRRYTRAERIALTGHVADLRKHAITFQRVGACSDDLAIARLDPIRRT